MLLNIYVNQQNVVCDTLHGIWAKHSHVAAMITSYLRIAVYLQITLKALSG